MLNVEARKQLRALMPVGMLATKPWLEAQGLNLHFLDNAVRSSTLTPLTPGVYVREGIVSWQGVVASLQRMTDTPVHVGALSALELEGVAHYLAGSTSPRITLCSEKGLPRWLNRIAVAAEFEWQGTRRLWAENVMSDSYFIREHSWQALLPAIYYSCPEKALLELLLQVPDAISFEHADQLMQGMHNLSPRKLDKLLRGCINVKVKRLFFWLAHRHQHAWLKHLSREDYALGTGKRMIAKGGRYESTWQITVPKDM